MIRPLVLFLPDIDFGDEGKSADSQPTSPAAAVWVFTTSSVGWQLTSGAGFEGSSFGGEAAAASASDISTSMSTSSPSAAPGKTKPVLDWSAPGDWQGEDSIGCCWIDQGILINSRSNINTLAWGACIHDFVILNDMLYRYPGFPFERYEIKIFPVTNMYTWLLAPPLPAEGELMLTSTFAPDKWAGRVLQKEKRKIWKQCVLQFSLMENFSAYVFFNRYTIDPFILTWTW